MNEPAQEIGDLTLAGWKEREGVVDAGVAVVGQVVPGDGKLRFFLTEDEDQVGAAVEESVDLSAGVGLARVRQAPSFDGTASFRALFELHAAAAMLAAGGGAGDGGNDLDIAAEVGSGKIRTEVTRGDVGDGQTTGAAAWRPSRA